MNKGQLEQIGNSCFLLSHKLTMGVEFIAPPVHNGTLLLTFWNFKNIGLCCFVHICPWRHHFIKLSEREVMVFTWLMEPFFWWVVIKGPSCVMVSGALGFWAVCALQKKTWFECNHLCWFQEHSMITADHEQAACLWQNDILFCH